MYTEYFNRIQSLSESQIDEISLWIQTSIENVETKEELFEKLKQLLLDKTSTELFEYRTSYTRWFGILGWDLFYSLTIDDVCEMVSKYTFIGFLNGENVWNKVVTYLHNNFLYEESMRENYTSVRRVFLNSEEILYIDKLGVPYTVSKFITESSSPHILNDSLSESEFLSRFHEKVVQNLFKNENEVDAFVITGRLRDLVNFFNGINPDLIWWTVDPYFSPQLYVTNKEKLVTQDQTEESLSNLSSVDHVVLEKSDDSSKIKMSYVDMYEHVQDVVSEIETEDERDEAIIIRLSELSQEYADDKINDLYYFNEQAGKFEWNDELIGSE